MNGGNAMVPHVYGTCVSHLVSDTGAGTCLMMPQALSVHTCYDI